MSNVIQWAINLWGLGGFNYYGKIKTSLGLIDILIYILMDMYSGNKLIKIGVKFQEQVGYF